jgi:hypothetical protein
MEHTTVSSKYEGVEPIVEVRAHEIVRSTEPAWKKLHGAAAGRDLLAAFALHKKEEREHEDSRP